LKVLVVSSKYPPEYSGSGLRAHRTYLRLREKFGIDFEVVCSSTETSESAQYELDGISVERIVSRRARNLNRNWSSTPLRRLTNAALAHIEARSVSRALKRKDFDVIHTFGYSPATTAAINWSRQHQVPLILELVNPMATPYQYLPGTRRFASQDLQHQSLIVAISKSLGEMCRVHGLTENIWVRPNPVDTGNFSMPSEQVKIDARKKISSATEKETLIVYVAKYITRKNHEFLLDVMTHLPSNFRLVLAGPPLTDRDLVPGLTADQIPALGQKATQLGIADRVEISHGFVDMAEYLAAAEVFCFPAEREAMGTPILESISSGVPVVANADESSFREWIVDGENGFLRSLDAAQWASVIEQAAQFTSVQKSSMSKKIENQISSELIDEKYFKLLSAMSVSDPGDLINVDNIL
jgi:glycosyltransferase involved in cell wall biosynthesis